jgi:uncharacterized membrane protein YgcG
MPLRRRAALPLPVAVLALALAGLALPTAARDRELRWRRIDVTARLDARGDLHVRETQVMVMSGDWNGGERRFRLEPGQKLRFEGLTWQDGPGTARPLVRGDLDEVGRFAFTDETTLRWRSRRPSDPPYSGTELTWVLQYTITRVVVDSGDGHLRLAHDFAFPDRPGVMERVSARLELDPAWEAEAPGAALSLEARDLPPGQGAVLAVPLRFVGTGHAPDVQRPPEPPPAFPAPLRLPLRALLGAALLAAAWGWWRNARARGLLDPLPSGLDEAWLAREVFAHPPEVIGAAWDDRVGAPEVSAVLARLQAQGKLRSSVEPGGFLGMGRKVRLELRVDRATLNDYERRLVDGLFFSGNTTDSAALRSHYARRGFDPADRIAGGVSSRAHALFARTGGDGPGPPGPRTLRGLRLAALALLACAVGLGALGLAWGEDVPVVVVPGVVGAFLTVLAGSAAARASRAVTGLRATALLALAPLGLWVALLDAIASGEAPLDLPAAGALAVGTHALLLCAGLLAVYALALPRLQPGEVAVRRRLAAARRHLARELRLPAPRLGDEAIPYLLALGLGSGLDRWVKVYGATAAGVSWSPGDSSSGPPAGGGRWTGGGGAFSGGGASGSWAALASVASGVPTPSSDSSGSGSGSSGGSSSGGGGGGGW